MEPVIDFFIVVSRTYPKGTIMTGTQYQWFYNDMAPEDRLTHRIQKICGEEAFRLASIIDKKAEKAALKQKTQLKGKVH